MKKNYISPELMIDEIAVVNCICLSLQDPSTPADDSEVLTKQHTVNFADDDFEF